MKSHDLVLSRGVIRINFYVLLPGFKYHMAGKDGKTETVRRLLEVATRDSLVTLLSVLHAAIWMTAWKNWWNKFRGEREDCWQK